VCTVIVSIEPQSATPVLLVGVRDEFTGRPWLPPARHWAEWPDLAGGIDLQAGGTWLAVNPAEHAVACVLNGQGRPAPEPTRLTRGRLPLLSAAGDGLDRFGTLDLARFDPFHLVRANLDTAAVWSWDGLELVHTPLGRGLHFVVNSGLEPAGDMASRVAYFRPRLLETPRPDHDWGSWLSIVDGDGLDPADPRALVLMREVSDGEFWGTGSISLVALGRSGIRYDFSANPGAGEFTPVSLPA
jgi:hypothetical protein